MPTQQPGSNVQEFRQEPRRRQVILVGESDIARKLRERVIRLSMSDINVLLTGETGAGKDHIAEAMHFWNPKRKDFVPVICGQVGSTMWETELFGHTQGAFTDARKRKPGLVEVAENGTLFLNEIDTVPLDSQPKLLRVTEKKSFRMVGDVQERPVRTRIIAATNADLKAKVEAGEFRHDLYYRIRSEVLEVPSLREHKEDIHALVEHFLEGLSTSCKFTPGAMTTIMDYHWPGNVRELRDAVERMVLNATEMSVTRDLAENQILIGLGEEPSNADGWTFPAKFPTYHEMERAYFTEALRLRDGNIARAAEAAGLHRPTFYSSLERLGLKGLPETLREAKKN